MREDVRQSIVLKDKKLFLVSPVSSPIVLLDVLVGFDVAGAQDGLAVGLVRHQGDHVGLHVEQV